MARRRFFVEQVRSGSAEISGENAQHLTRVLRVEVGQTFEITDNHRVWLATVESARKDMVRFRVTEEINPGPPLPEVTLYLALIKFERFEWAVEKAVELGVTRIVPVNAARSERGLFEGAQKRVERWRRIAHEASEQSRRLSAPEIDSPAKMAEALKDSATHRLWCDERPGAPGLAAAFHPQEGDSTALLIGPEGGWTEPERTQFDAAGWKGVSLGPLVLRAETAVCAALAVIAQGWIAVSLQSNQA
ncbi:MAG TPA: RsmE family RNA methyltransferase [Bryobacteraceae bacterium]|nr:RsmE family RNA methyltransferase [Bryobacteraceae bacterium]